MPMPHLNFEAARFCDARVWSGFRKVADGMDEYIDYAKGENLNHRLPLWVKANRKLDRSGCNGHDA